MGTEKEIITARIRKWISFFIIALILSGVTAFPIETELKFLMEQDVLPSFIQIWVENVYHAISDVNNEYPFLAYGTDWLAFAHIVIATVFIGPMINPLRNKWVIQFGMIACLMVFPLALIAGPIRNIPFYWQLIDCSFGVIGLIPLAYVYKQINMLEKLEYEKIKQDQSRLKLFEKTFTQNPNLDAENI